MGPQVNPPVGESPPLCACGCGLAVNWKPYVGWSRLRRDHFDVAKRLRMSEARRRAYAGRRRRDFDPTGPGVYATAEYREAREALVVGKPCCQCGATDNIHAHHQVPGDDSTLIPLCGSCHATLHHGHEGAKGSCPPPGAIPPLCRCGCGQPVGWKRVRGWAEYRKGHGGAKVPARRSTEPPPLCACGCGEPVQYRYGKGWNQYRRGHEQRVIGHWTARR